MEDLHIKLSNDHKRSLMELAERRGQDMSSFIRSMIEDEYQNNERNAELKSLIIDLQDSFKKYEKLLFD